jgi:hypothetical protein
VLSDLFKRFRRAFPEVTYELPWESPTINAQAWRLGSAQFVRVYGGLVRHPAITKYGLALILAHVCQRSLRQEQRTDPLTRKPNRNASSQCAGVMPPSEW